ncbi:Rrf2 family transcriptional regulator [bacterium]|jgi:Rrf2 family protein|nr:Rrf2 family transcriptional regulator [bacterium]MBT3581031.1 Rrf2 family transcriptional regulator [bacterium]MBT4552058.1 Rrf2 family transcriptional regulator [bacterium]MBT5988279.1 Rrf2 family transcriptional regulator [bacterium]MBT7088211.1 Rrf2 family transcriptional regulator [bacterium]
MMKLSAEVNFGIQIMINLAKKSKANSFLLSEIALVERKSISYARQILGKLRNAELVNRFKDTHSKYSLAKNPEEITLLNIFEAINGKITLLKNKTNMESGKGGKVTEYYLDKAGEEIAYLYKSIKLSDLLID